MGGVIFIILIFLLLLLEISKREISWIFYSIKLLTRIRYSNKISGARRSSTYRIGFQVPATGIYLSFYFWQGTIRCRETPYSCPEYITCFPRGNNRVSQGLHHNRIAANGERGARGRQGSVRHLVGADKMEVGGRPWGRCYYMLRQRRWRSLLGG